MTEDEIKTETPDELRARARELFQKIDGVVIFCEQSEIDEHDARVSEFNSICGELAEREGRPKPESSLRILRPTGRVKHESSIPITNPSATASTQ